MDEKKAKGRDYLVNIVFSFLAFTWVINLILFDYLQIHGYELPKFLFPIATFSLFYWLFTGLAYQSIAWMIGSNGPAMVIPLIVTAIYWRILALWIIGKYDQMRQRNSNAASQASAMEKAISPNPAKKAIGAALFIIFMLILIWILFDLFF
jgi:hypothetical protein